MYLNVGVTAVNIKTEATRGPVPVLQDSSEQISFSSCRRDNKHRTHMHIVLVHTHTLAITHTYILPLVHCTSCSIASGTLSVYLTGCLAWWIV